MRWLVIFLVGCATNRPVPSRCRPGEACWPSEAEWSALAAQLTGKLVVPEPAKAATNPFELEDQAGATQSLGWYRAWTAALSARAVAAETPADVVAAVKFAREHRLRVVPATTISAARTPPIRS